MLRTVRQKTKYKCADAIIVACDKQVDMARFAGKRLIKTNVKAPIKDAKGLINQALSSPVYEAEQGCAQSVSIKPHRLVQICTGF